LNDVHDGVKIFVYVSGWLSDVACVSREKNLLFSPKRVTLT